MCKIQRLPTPPNPQNQSFNRKLNLSHKAVKARKGTLTENRVLKRPSVAPSPEYGRICEYGIMSLL